MRGDARHRPGARTIVEIAKHAVVAVGLRGERGDVGHVVGRRALDDGIDALARHQRERIDEGEPTDAIARQLGRLHDHHAAAARPDEHDILQVLGEEELSHLARVRADGDAGTHGVTALGAPIEAWREHRVTGGAQSRGHRLPDPAPLVRAVDQDVGGHLS